MKSLLIYSGGLDSTVLLYYKQNDIQLAVNFNYCSKHNDIERKYAEHNCKELNIELTKINLDFIQKHFKSNLLIGGGDIPDGHYTDEVMKKTVVPFRNGIMLSIATGIAESNNIQKVLIANHSGDHTIYPDCRPGFSLAMHKAIKLGTWNGIELEFPFINYSKKDIAELGIDLEVPFQYTYSCYKGGALHCGTCGTCIERKEALKGFDPTEYLDEENKRYSANYNNPIKP